ncbi:hypothetical protein [Legionella cherrii]|uniref:Outer membrane protein beta-barrel domain-containing protein n=1 Tax=Legionella cherrii TaxID=28084 RepID=A0ABY6T4F5_9GAMM|nr:hypothetical protein [Legionella cherrii]VEB35214.1 Uncharacterised protein [Legionella cherrii]
MRLPKILYISFALPIVCSAGTMGNVSPSNLWSVPIQGGFFGASQGKEQHIDIDGLIGNQYTLDSNSQISGLVGVGLYFNGPSFHWLQLSYGVDAFYLGQTKVRGDINQEDLFTNFSYQYSIQNVPVYAAAKALISTNNPKYNITVDAGIGPNFMWTSGYHETPLEDFAIPDNAFEGASTTHFSVMAGAGIRLNNIIGPMPVECGYRFFYLGKSHLNAVNDQYLDNLTTGDTYANALVCAVTL